MSEDDQERRAQVMGTIARRIHDVVNGLDVRVALVAVDGVDGAGKTHLADECAEILRSDGTEVLRASVDGFHHPAEIRYRRGRASPDGFYRDSYDLAALQRLLLEPLRRGRGEPVVTAVHDVEREEPISLAPVAPPKRGVLLFDGIFLHRRELIDLWDLSIWLGVPFSVSVPRGAARDETDPDPSAPSQHRYVEGQRLYLAECSPRTVATLVIDNTDLDRPRITTDRRAGR